jgi:hypothetical protein
MNVKMSANKGAHLVPIAMATVCRKTGLQLLNIYFLQESQAYPECLLQSACVGYQNGV